MPEPSRWRSWLPIVVLIVAAVLPYLNSLQGSFHYDDAWDITRNPSIRSFHDVLGARPLSRWLTFFTLWINYSLHGTGCLPAWHAANIALHAACVLMLYATLRRLLCDWRGAGQAALIAAVLFAVHPLASEPVNYIRARSSMLYTLMTWVALYGAVFARRCDKPWGKAAGAAMAIAGIVLAAASKEVGALSAAGVVAIYAAGVLSRRWGVRGSLAALGVLAGAAAVTAGAMHLTGRLALAFQLADGPNLGQYMQAELVAFWQYVSLAIWPLASRLSVDHHILYYPLREYHLWDADVLAAGLAIFAVAAVGVWRIRRPWAVLVLLPLLAMAPYFFIVAVDMLVEYKFYLPLTALCGLAGMGLSRLTEKSAAWGWLLVAAVAVAMAFATAGRNGVWLNERTLWADAYTKAPRRARPPNALAWALLTEGTPADAPRALELARRSFDRRYCDPWHCFDPFLLDTLAEAYFANGHGDEAVLIETRILEQSSINPEYFRGQLNRFRDGRPGKALPVAQP